MNHTCLCFPSRSWSSFTNRGGMEGWVGIVTTSASKQSAQKSWTKWCRQLRFDMEWNILCHRRRFEKLVLCNERNFVCEEVMPDCTVDNGGCSHVCHNVTFAPHRSRCFCVPGYQLQRNKHTCTGEFKYQAVGFPDKTKLIEFKIRVDKY